MAKLETMNVSGGQYAKVATRLKDFREKHPRASLKTTVTPMTDGTMVQAYILTDKADETSADATGTAFYTAKQMASAKAFEKLETIAVGRALALLGWLNDGEIASSEEMEEFEAMRAKKREEGRQLAVQTASKSLRAAKTFEELRDVFVALPKDVKAEMEDLKNEMKAKLEKVNANN